MRRRVKRLIVRIGDSQNQEGSFKQFSWYNVQFKVWKKKVLWYIKATTDA